MDISQLHPSVLQTIFPGHLFTNGNKAAILTQITGIVHQTLSEAASLGRHSPPPILGGAEESGEEEIGREDFDPHKEIRDINAAKTLFSDSVKEDPTTNPVGYLASLLRVRCGSGNPHVQNAFSELVSEVSQPVDKLLGMPKDTEYDVVTEFVQAEDVNSVIVFVRSQASAALLRCRLACESIDKNRKAIYQTIHLVHSWVRGIPEIQADTFSVVLRDIYAQLKAHTSLASILREDPREDASLDELFSVIPATHKSDLLKQDPLSLLPAPLLTTYNYSRPIPHVDIDDTFENALGTLTTNRVLGTGQPLIVTCLLFVCAYSKSTTTLASLLERKDFKELRDELSTLITQILLGKTDLAKGEKRAIGDVKIAQSPASPVFLLAFLLKIVTQMERSPVLDDSLDPNMVKSLVGPIIPYINSLPLAVKDRAAAFIAALPNLE